MPGLYCGDLTTVRTRHLGLMARRAFSVDLNRSGDACCDEDPIVSADKPVRSTLTG